MASKKTSAAWLHFVAIDNGKNAKCNHCSRTVVVANGSTGNLFRHMKLKHPAISVEKFVKRKPFYPYKHAKSVPVPAENNISSEERISNGIEMLHTKSVDRAKFSDIPQKSSQQPVSFYLVQPYDENKCQEIDRQLLKVIVKNLLPFDIVESKEFIKFVNTLNPSYAIPNRKTLANDVLMSSYQAVVKDLKSALKSLTAVALTVDRWTSVNSENFIAFTVHYLNKDLELKSNLLECYSSCEKQSPYDIALFLQELAVNWNLCNKVLTVVTDGSEEMVKAVNNCDLNHMPCFAHLLNKIVQEGLAEINQFILKVRNVVQYFRKNSMALNKFYTIQNQMGLSQSKLIKDTPSRWNTTFDMLTNFLKNKVPLLSSIQQLQLNLYPLSSADFLYLENVIKVLVIFNSIKVEMCSENCVSVSKIPYMVHFMSRQLHNLLRNITLEPEIAKMACKIKDGLRQFEVLEMDELVCQGILLDPRFKKRGFPNNLFEEACVTLRHNVTSVREDIMKEKIDFPNLSQPEQYKIESEFLMDMWGEFETKDPSPHQNQSAAASLEIDAFINDSYLPIRDSPLRYWANISNQNKFPALFELAKRALCIPATSVSCQQIYSKAGTIFLKKRSYLPSSKVGKFLFLHQNL